jgi:hypothetical protein
MFVLGFHFPASEGNKVSDDKVLAKLEGAVGSSMSSVASIKLYAGNSEYKTISNTGTILAKGLVQYFELENANKEPKYLIFTNKYQLAALVRDNEKDSEALEIAAHLDKTRDQITVEVSYK